MSSVGGFEAITSFMPQAGEPLQRCGRWNPELGEASFALLVLAGTEPSPRAARPAGGAPGREAQAPGRAQGKGDEVPRERALGGQPSRIMPGPKDAG